MAPTLRRSKRLSGSTESGESVELIVHIRPRPTTGQLRLPTPPPAKSRVKKRRRSCRRANSKKCAQLLSRCCPSEKAERGRQPKRILPTALSTQDAPEPMDVFRHCEYCNPESSPERCAHNRGQDIPADASFFGPDIVLPSVKTDHNDETNHKRAILEKRTVTSEDERDIEEIIDYLKALTRPLDSTSSTERLYSRTAGRDYRDFGKKSKTVPLPYGSIRQYEEQYEILTSVYPDSYVPQYEKSAPISCEKKLKDNYPMCSPNVDSQHDLLTDFSAEESKSPMLCQKHSLSYILKQENGHKFEQKQMGSVPPASTNILQPTSQAVKLAMERQHEDDLYMYGQKSVFDTSSHPAASSFSSPSSPWAGIGSASPIDSTYLGRSFWADDCQQNHPFMAGTRAPPPSPVVPRRELSNNDLTSLFF